MTGYIQADVVVKALRSVPLAPHVVGDDTLLPSEDQPSDHLALLAELDWA